MRLRHIRIVTGSYVSIVLSTARACLTYTPDKYMESSRRPVQGGSLMLPAIRRRVNKLAVMTLQFVRSPAPCEHVRGPRVYACCICDMRGLRLLRDVPDRTRYMLVLFTYMFTYGILRVLRP